MIKWLLCFCVFAGTVYAQNTDSLLHILQKTPADTHQVSLLYDLGNGFWKKSDDSLATLYLNQAVQLSRKVGNPRRQAEARLLLVRIQADYQTDLQTAFAHLDSSLKIAKSLKDLYLEGQTYFRRAQLYDTNLDKKKEIKPLLEKALRLFEMVDDKVRQATVYEELAMLAAHEGKLAEAIDIQLKARRIQEQIRDYKGLQFTLSNLGHNYIIIGRYDNALQCFQEAEAIAKRLNDARILPYAIMQRGDILEKQGRYTDALKAFQEAAAIYEKTKSVSWLNRAYARVGKEYILLKEYDKALKYTSKADSLYKNHKDYSEMLDHNAQSNFGQIYLAKKQYARVVPYAEKGLEYTVDANLPRETAEYHRQLAEAYEHLGQTNKALYHFKAFKTQSDSVFNKESEQKITVSSMNYEFDKKQQTDKLHIQTLENEKLSQTRNFLIGVSVLGFFLTAFILWSNRRLRIKNVELIGKNREIEEALFKGQKIERKRVASELHDNLNTKLAALRWRLEALDISKYEGADQKIHQSSLEMLEDIYADVRLISHSMIPAELETHGLAAALQKLIGKLNISSKTEFHLVDNSSANRPAASIEHQFYNIALELINNILKHAHASQVWISVSQTENGMTLTISDNGVGMEFAAPSDGMGMKNLKNRVEALGGLLEIESGTGRGTKIEVGVTFQNIAHTS